jgi:hypothetical protein
MSAFPSGLIPSGLKPEEGRGNSFDNWGRSMVNLFFQID